MTKVKKVAEADGTPVVGEPEEFGLSKEEADALELEAARERIEAKKAAGRAAPVITKENLGYVPETGSRQERNEAREEHKVLNPEIPEEIRHQFEGRQVSLLEANLQARAAARENYDYLTSVAEQAREAIIASGGRVTRRAQKNLRAPIPTDQRPKPE